METKDLVLLMLIPIILIGLIVYTDKSPTITGSVAVKQEKSNILGTYSILPSFKTKIDYDLEEYKNIKETLNKIIGDCIKTENIDKCFQDKSNELNWKCQEAKDEISEILYDFVDKFNECLNIEEEGVVCRFSLNERELIRPIKSFDIILTSENQKTKVEIKQGANARIGYINLENLVYTVYDHKDALSENINPITIRIEYVDKKPVIKDIFAIDDNSNIIPLSKKFLLYKKDNKVKFVEFPGSSFELPTANKIIDLPRIKGFKFCSKSKKQVYAYDESENTVKLRDIVYRFAVTYPAPQTPPPIKSLIAEDKLMAEKFIVLKWDKPKLDDGSDILDFDHYNIYCSKSSLLDKKINEIKIDSVKPIMAVKSKSDVNYDVWYADTNKCEKDGIEDEVDYYFVVTAVSKANKESKAIVQATAKSIDDLAPGVQKIILINSDKAKEEKTSSACIKLPVTESSDIGAIEVRFFAPEKNEDEITYIETNEPLTYNLYFSKQIPITDNLNDCSNPKKCVTLYFAPKDELNTREIQSRTFPGQKEIEDTTNNNKFKGGEIYCFTIVAKDKNNNIIKTLPHKFIKPQQWIDLEAKPILKGFFNDEGEIKYS